MADDLNYLIKKAKSVEMSATDIEQQRQSFAYGNTNIENSRITRETIVREAEALKKTNG